MSASVKQKALVILGFHKIGEPSAGGWDTWFYIPELQFQNQLMHLQASGWEVVDLSTVLLGLERPDSLPHRSVLITFDDGYQSTLQVAAPVLGKFGYPAVVFVPTDFIGRSNDFDLNHEPREPICTFNELLELEQRGISVQSHGSSHRRFSDLDLQEQETELIGSRVMLESRLHTPVRLFSFPYGDSGHNQDLASLMKRAGYQAACLYGGGPNAIPVSDPFRLTRLAMGPDTDLSHEFRHAARGM